MIVTPPLKHHALSRYCNYSFLFHPARCFQPHAQPPCVEDLGPFVDHLVWPLPHNQSGMVRPAGLLQNGVVYHPVFSIRPVSRSHTSQSLLGSTWPQIKASHYPTSCCVVISSWGSHVSADCRSHPRGVLRAAPLRECVSVQECVDGNHSWTYDCSNLSSHAGAHQQQFRACMHARTHIGPHTHTHARTHTCALYLYIFSFSLWRQTIPSLAKLSHSNCRRQQQFNISPFYRLNQVFIWGAIDLSKMNFGQVD